MANEQAWLDGSRLQARVVRPAIVEQNVTGSAENIVVLGVGNILLQDEGIGVRVIDELKRRYDFPERAQIIDEGTQGLWLLSTIQQAEHLIVVDAVTAGGKP